VAEYFAPKAKKRWCLSLYENVGSQALGAFPQAAMVSFPCCYVLHACSLWFLMHCIFACRYYICSYF